MSLAQALAVAATLISLAFGLCTFERWLKGRKPQELAWSLALAQFSLASAFLAIGIAIGWHGWIFRGFYTFGAITNVPTLALGTVWLLQQKRTARLVTFVVAALVLFGAGVVAAAPFRAALPLHELPEGSKVFTVLPRVFAAGGSAIAALYIFGGAIWSAVRIRRRRVVLSNGLIALGTATISAKGLLPKGLDQTSAFSIALALGIAIVFSGFLIAATAPKRNV